MVVVGFFILYFVVFMVFQSQPVLNNKQTKSKQKMTVKLFSDPQEF